MIINMLGKSPKIESGARLKSSVTLNFACQAERDDNRHFCYVKLVSMGKPTFEVNGKDKDRKTKYRSIKSLQKAIEKELRKDGYEKVVFPDSWEKLDLANLYKGEL